MRTRRMAILVGNRQKTHAYKDKNERLTDRQARPKASQPLWHAGNESDACQSVNIFTHKYIDLKVSASKKEAAAPPSRRQHNLSHLKSSQYLRPILHGRARPYTKQSICYIRLFTLARATSCRKTACRKRRCKHRRRHRPCSLSSFLFKVINAL